MNLVTSESSNEPFMDSFRFVLPGYNVRPIEMSGAIGREQIKKLPHMLQERRRNASLFYSTMNKNRHIRIQEETGCSSWFGFTLIIKEDSSLSRSSLIDKLENHGFEVRPIVTGNFTKSEAINYFDFSQSFGW